MKNIAISLVMGLVFLIFFIGGVVVDENIIRPNIEAQENPDSALNNTIKVINDFEVSKKISINSFVANPKFISSPKLETMINLSSDEKNSINETFSELISLAKDSGICTGGEYSINPLYNYNKSARTTVGQILNGDFICEFSKDKLNIYNDFVKKANEIVAKNDLVKMNTPAINPSSSKMTKEDKYELQGKMIQKINENAKKLSSELKKVCAPSEISFYFRENSPMPRLMKASSFSEASAPIVEDQKCQLRANVTFICK